MNTEANTEVAWKRCRTVSVSGEEIFWVSANRRYSLFEAYGAAAHRDFMSADGDGALRAFVRTWGPLRDAEAGRDSLAWYRRAREKMVATVSLMVALERGETLRTLLERLAVCSEESDPLAVHLTLRYDRINRLEDARAWCRTASSTDVERLCVSFLNDFPFTCVPRFVVEGRHSKHQIRASLFINNLHEALWWMVWQDTFSQQPFSFCENCGKFIRRDGKRLRKFCDPRCAKLQNDRASWRRKHGKGIRYKEAEP